MPRSAFSPVPATVGWRPIWILYNSDVVAGRFGLAAVASVSLAIAQSGSAPSERLLAPYGLGNFSPLYRQSVDARFTAYPAYQRGEYSVVSKILEAFWK